MAHLMLVNPKKRRKSSAAKPAKRVKRRKVSYAKNPIQRKHHRRYRRNPISGGGIVGQLKNSAIGAAGALAVDVAMAKLPIPVQYKSGPMLHVAQGLISLGLGFAVAKFGKNKTLGMQLAEGGLTVAMYAAARTTLAPSLGLGDDLLGYSMNGYSMGDSGLLGADSYMGDYETDTEFGGIDDDNEGGWLSPAPISSY